jgi:hypothetical protein
MTLSGAGVVSVVAAALLGGVAGFLLGQHHHAGLDQEVRSSLFRQAAVLEAQTEALRELSVKGQTVLDAMGSIPRRGTDDCQGLGPGQHPGMAAAAAAPSAVQAPAPSSVPYVEPTPESVAAYERGTMIVEEAIARGRWTDGDQTGLRELHLSWTPQQNLEIRTRLNQAINSGTVKIQVSHMPAF